MVYWCLGNQAQLLSHIRLHQPLPWARLHSTKYQERIVKAVAGADPKVNTGSVTQISPSDNNDSISSCGWTGSGIDGIDDRACPKGKLKGASSSLGSGDADWDRTLNVRRGDDVQFGISHACDN